MGKKEDWEINIDRDYKETKMQEKVLIWQNGTA